MKPSNTSKLNRLSPDVTADNSSNSSNRSMWTDSQSAEIQQIIASLGPGAVNLPEAPSTGNIPNLEAFREEEIDEASSPDPEPEKEEDVTQLQMKIKKYEAKQERRREQNRRAAQRSREKRKAEGDYLSKKTHKLMAANTELRAEIESLTKERDDLKLQIEAHLSICPLTTGACSSNLVTSGLLEGATNQLQTQSNQTESGLPLGGATNLVTPGLPLGGATNHLQTQSNQTESNLLPEAAGYQGATSAHGGTLQSGTGTESNQDSGLPSFIENLHLVIPETTQQDVNLSDASNLLYLHQSGGHQNRTHTSNIPVVIPEVPTSVYLPSVSKQSR